MCDFTTGVTSRNPGAGTTRYQAKELLLDFAQPNHMSDLYAFGGLILAVIWIFQRVFLTLQLKNPFYLRRQ